MPNLIPVVAAQPPAAGSYAPGRPTRAATAQSIGGATNGLAGWAALRRFVKAMQMAAGASDTADAATLDANRSQCRWRPSSSTTHLHVDLWLLAEVGKAGASISLRLYEHPVGGVSTLVDGPVTWSVANNFLGAEAPAAGFEFNDDGEVDGVVPIRSRDILVHTGWSEVPAGGAVSSPRLLKLSTPDIDGGDPLRPPPHIIDIEATNVRAYTMVITELYGVVL